MGADVSGNQPLRTPQFGEGMELRLLRCFVAVADAGSVTAAAAELYVSQPTLSRQLHRLEREIDLVLFRPCDGRLVITPAGRELLPRARGLLAAATAVRAFARDLAAGATVSVHVATSTATLHDVLAPFIATAPPNLPPLTFHPADAQAPYEALNGDVGRGCNSTARTSWNSDSCSAACARLCAVHSCTRRERVGDLDRTRRS